MFAINEIAPGTQQPSATQLQMQLIASTAMAQRVTAVASTDASGDAGYQGAGARADAPAVKRATQPEPEAPAKPEERAENAEAAEAEARSVVEAQEKSSTDTTIRAAFQARYALSDLLSVIRDPEDRMLPQAPSDQAA